MITRYLCIVRTRRVIFDNVFGESPAEIATIVVKKKTKQTDEPKKQLEPKGTGDTTVKS